VTGRAPPSVALLPACSLAPFAPQHAASVGPLHDVVGGFDTRHVQEYPQRLACSCQTPRQRPGFLFTGGMLAQEMVETRIPGPPLPHRGPLCAHRTPPLHLGVHAVSNVRNPSVEVFRQSLGRAEQMRSAALPEPLPVRIDQRPITHQEAHPVGNARDGIVNLTADTLIS
jgi:hypothetical protein